MFYLLTYLLTAAENSAETRCSDGWRVQALRAKVAEGGRVVSSESMEKMIDTAVEKVTKSCYDTDEDVDENIKEHISGVTQEFIDKVIQQIFADMNADKD